ncbi:hypothetical protein I8752_23035 [Nostocaceae cyanobacterium CENA369]|uniref:Uncharacterized protein n=1 Tax=Dendronalium phyllosphericum CENA369 TaxID=1725256 RepID=A0A8J7IFT3_9NOST|nr:hypothetical protein [Dendronalium phyllosphericum]MBH8575822.1 hypothetical protein [Dendronalium phyllosphericum CENA369]
MSSNSQNSSTTNLLGSFAGLVGIFSIFLYFLGWIYRWAYFEFFLIEVTSLNLPIQSFLLVPLQAILGDLWIFFRAILVLIVTVLLIKATIWLISSLKASTAPGTSQLPISRFTQNLHSFWLFRPLRSFAQLLPKPLRYEIVVVLWILAALFWIGRWQGNADAYRDALNNTSTRPIVTLVSPSDKIALGRNLDDLLINPSLKGSRIIGDVEQFRQILGRETNDNTNPKQPIVWRLLIENNNWVYLFPAMLPGGKPNQRPPVLAVNTGDGRVQLLILSRPKVLL